MSSPEVGLTRAASRAYTDPNTATRPGWAHACHEQVSDVSLHAPDMWACQHAHLLFTKLGLNVK